MRLTVFYFLKSVLAFGLNYGYLYIFLFNFQLVELSKAQDIEAGDGTTSVVVVAGSLLEAAEKLLQRGIHPTIISDAFQRAAGKAVEILAGMSKPIELSDKESLIKSASTALNSKVQIVVNHGHKHHFPSHHLIRSFHSLLPYLLYICHAYQFCITAFHVVCHFAIFSEFLFSKVTNV
jgi:hypothetical protein